MISRRAQVVALGIFTLGKCSHVRFRTPSRISPECLEGLLELEKEGMLDIKRSKRDGWECQATEKIGRPMSDFKAIDPENPDEVFPIVKQE